MSKPFDMELFLAGVLIGSHVARQRHLRQATALQMAISNRWGMDNPWSWKRKHLAWYLDHHITRHAKSTHYHYLLTIRLIALRLGKTWQFRHSTQSNNRPIPLRNSVEPIS